MKWKPKVNNKYYVVANPNNEPIPERHIWNNDVIDVRNYYFSNCFKTKKQAEVAARAIRRILRGSK